MTIDEFKAVVAISGLRVYVWENAWLVPHNPPIRRYTASLTKGHVEDENRLDVINLIVAEFTGHTKKSALKKLKDWYYWEARNANRR